MAKIEPNNGIGLWSRLKNALHPPIDPIESQNNNKYANTSFNKRKKKFVDDRLFSFFEKLTEEARFRPSYFKSRYSTADILIKIEELIEQGADVNYKNEYNDTVLLKSCLIKDKEVYKRLRQKGSEISTNNYGQTILHNTAESDNVELLEYLIAIENVNLEEKTYQEEQTSLHYAAKNGNADIVECLIKSKIDLEVRDHQDRTALYLAAERGQTEVVSILIKTGAEVDVLNKFGQRAVYWIIAKSPELAPDVLDEYLEYNTFTKNEIYHLEYVSTHCDDTNSNSITEAKSILSYIVENRKLDLIVHPDISQLIRVKWKRFGKKRCYLDLFFTLIYVTIWNLIGAIIPYNEKHDYKFPEQWWRIFFALIGVIGVFILIFLEVLEVRTEYNYEKKCRAQRFRELDDEARFCHYDFRKNTQFLNQEKDDYKATKLLIPYLSNMWNLFDMASILLITISIATHIIDITDHSEYHARIHIRCLSATIIFISIRLLKVGRVVNEQFGVLVITLTSSIRDIGVWFGVFIIFLLPFTSAFWMLFGKTENLERYDKTAFLLYLIAFGADIDDDRERLKERDRDFTDPLIGVYIAITSLVLVNIFIALLTATFNFVKDSSRAQLMLSRAVEVLCMEHYMNENDRYKHLVNLKNLTISKLSITEDLMVSESKLEPVKELIDSVAKKNKQLEDRFAQIENNIKTPSIQNENNSPSLNPIDYENEYMKCQQELDELKELISVLIQKKQTVQIEQQMEQETFIIERDRPHVDVINLNEIDLSNQTQLENLFGPLNQNDNQTNQSDA